MKEDSEYLAFEISSNVWAVEHSLTKYIYGIRFKSQNEAKSWAAARIQSPTPESIARTV